MADVEAAGKTESEEAEVSADCAQRTRAALRELSARWRDVEHPGDSGGADKGVAGAAARLAEDPNGLTQESLAWSNEVGLNYCVPQDAFRGCEAVAQSRGRDGLQPSTVGARRRTHKGLLVAPAPPCGFGVFATELLPARTKLGEYVGEVRDYVVWLEEIKGRKKKARGSDGAVPFIPEELYAAWAGDGPSGGGVVIDAFAVGNTMRFINCSCSPNCKFQPFGRGTQGHYRLEVFTVRDIEPWEQLSVDYGWYFDPPTLKNVQDQALEAYNADREAIMALERLRSPEPILMAPADEAAVPVLASVLLENLQHEEHGRTLTPPVASFLRRFVDSKAFATLLQLQRNCGDDGSRISLPEARSIKDIPEELWSVYEVVGGARVGIPCRCALEPSLNRHGRCSGIIGRPLQTAHSGRDNGCDT
eukprot:TRINITY_DN22138_c0_g1_i1.p1 TRINITY_DN22138_c0_g1~~TRINITY_DN22138_c0_g1_i1.p1  ORF type:complete len:446 (+),score=74.03 TRINITY_DN22138_c0_g1_i1:83-1339(+)